MSSTIYDFLDYSLVKSAILIVNLCICLSYPLNFGIYCGMSRQFRETFKELFMRRVGHSLAAGLQQQQQQLLLSQERRRGNGNNDDDEDDDAGGGEGGRGRGGGRNLAVPDEENGNGEITATIIHRQDSLVTRKV